MSAPLTAGLGLGPGAAVAVAGCGGKTTLVGALARENRHQKVLVAPTARIRPMAAGEAVTLLGADACRAHRPQAGVQCCGAPTAEGKLAGLPLEVLAEVAPGYDLVLMEADGSRGLPCKGWNDHEPVVPDFATHTVGVLTLLGLGRRVSEETVHRPPQFCALTGLAPGDIIGLPALAAMAGRPEGMLRTARGRRLLFIAQVEDAETLDAAKQLAALIRREYPGAVQAIFAGSAKQGLMREL